MYTVIDKLITKEKQVLDLVRLYTELSENLLLTYFNQHCFNIYKKDHQYKDLIDNRFQTYIDGTGIYYALRFLGIQNIQKYNASDLNEKIFEYFIISKKRIYIIGGKFCEENIIEMQKKGLNLCGYQNGYFEPDEEVNIIYDIDKQNPDFIILGMGVPKQELLAGRINDNLNSSKIICVGNFLEFYFGKVKRIPQHFRNLGFEWAYRLYTEPKRLWKRYIIGIPEFISAIIILKLKYRIFKHL